MENYFGIGVEGLKTEFNYGTLFRSAKCFSSSFIFLVNKRFKKQCSDTLKVYIDIPLYEYSSAKDFIDHIPYDCIPIGIEITDKSTNLVDFIHPKRAVYILGPEDGRLSNTVLLHCKSILKIPTDHCLNVSVAGSIVMYDRLLKSLKENIQR